MSANAASESALGRLHEAVAEELLKRLKFGEVIYDTKSGEMIQMPGCCPATLSVITRFLDSNDITCVADATNAIGDLQRELAEKRSRKGRFGKDQKVVNFK